MDKNFEIADIIVAFMKGEVTPEQLVRLDEWLGESDENKRLFISLQDEKNFEHQIEVRKELDIERAFDRVKTRKRVKKYRGIGKISIAASIAIFVMASVVMLYTNNESHVESSFGQEFITGGTNRALLTLSTGVQVELDRQDTLLQSNMARIRVDRTMGVSYEVDGDATSSELVYNVMEVPTRAEFQLVLSDGTKVWLNAGSRLRYPERFVGNEREVELTGEAYFDVIHDETAPFTVKTSRSVITVLGTEFNVRDYKGEANQTTLVRGRVAVCDSTNESFIILPGQQVIIDEDGTKVTNVETLYFTSWKDGYFVFNEVTVGEIMKELAKWYDFDCFFANSTVSDIRLTARLKKYDDISVILDILSNTGDIHFSQKGRVITVKEIGQ